MSYKMKLMIFVLFVNLLVTVIYLVWNYIRRKERLLSVWMKAALMLLCPVIGPLFVGVAFLLYHLFFAQKMDLSDVVFSKERTEKFLHPDEDMEKNMVSLEEALEITDRQNLRTLMLNVLRGDYQKSLSSIVLALDSEDSETAHYAASVLQDILNDYRTKVQEQYLACQEKDDKQFANCIRLIEYMNPILEQKVLTELEQRSMTEKLEGVLQIAWELDAAKISSVVYEKVCERLLDIAAYDSCRTWCERAVRQYPRSPGSYTCQLKLYFSCGDRESFFRVMQELRSLDIVIDKETLEMIRTFM